MAVRFLECCCACPEDAQEALWGGASRIELCENLEIGGVTPSEESIRNTLEICRGKIPVNVLVRPRGGDFVFSDYEFLQMSRSISLCRELGADGVVIGALTAKGDVDAEHIARLIAEARPMSVTFHRAFDVCRDPLTSFEDIITLGCDRLLTSGHETDAFAGRWLIAELVRLSAGRIIVMPGCGVRASNIKELERVTHASEFHSSSHGHSGRTSAETVRSIIGE